MTMDDSDADDVITMRARHGTVDVDTKSSAVIDSHEQSQAVIIDSHHQLSPSSTVTDSHEQSSATDTESVIQVKASPKKEPPIHVSRLSPKPYPKTSGSPLVV